MLRSKDGSMASGRRSAAGVAAAIVIAFVGVGTMAIRGEAETVDSQRKADVVDSADATADEVDLSFMPRNGMAMIVVRPREMSRRPALAATIDEVAEVWTKAMQQDPTGVKWPTVLPGDVDCVACQVNAAPAPGNECNMAIVLVHAVDAVAWLTKNCPQAQRVDGDGFAYVRIGADASTFPMLIAQRDSRTLVLSDNVGHLREMATSKAPPRTGAADSTASSGKGVASISGSYADLPGGFVGMLESVGLLLPDATLDQQLESMVRTIARPVQEFRMTIDVETETNQAVFQLRIACDAPASAELVRSMCDAYRQMAGQIAEQMIESAADPAIQASMDADGRKLFEGMSFLAALVSNATVELPAGSNEVRMEGRASMPESLMSLLGFLYDRVTEYP